MGGGVIMKFYKFITKCTVNNKCNFNLHVVAFFIIIFVET